MFSPTLATEQVLEAYNRRAGPFLPQDERDQQACAGKRKNDRHDRFLARHKTEIRLSKSISLLLGDAKDNRENERHFPV
ncbi:hypothetical protein ACLK2A_03345 [Escherichia coli]